MDTVPTLQSEAAARKAAAAADPQPRAMTGRSSPSGNGAGDSSNAATNSSGAEGRVNKLMDTLVLLLSDLALVGEAERRAVQGRWTVLVEASKQTGTGLEAGKQYNEGAKDLNGRNKTAQEKANQEGKDEAEVGLEVMHFKLKAIKEAKKGKELDRVTHAVNGQEVLTAAKDSMWEWHAEGRPPRDSSRRKSRP